MLASSLAFWASIAVVGYCLPSGTSPATPLLRRTEADASDLSWIKNWASVGDSWSTGIGAGNKNGGWGDWLCSRYDASFPAIINIDPRLGTGTREFTYWPCSGASVDDVRSSQINALADASQDLITVTGGGNDADFTDILNECVFQWLSDADPLNSKCPDRLSKAQSVIDSDDFHSKLDDLISAAKSKIKPGGHIYYVGYAQYFGTDDDQCDSVTWAYWYELGKREYLTKDKRIKMNTLVENMNNALSAAVDRAGSSVTFIDYSKYITESKGRFCEAGYPEDNPNRYGLLFYEWDTDDSKPETDGEVQQKDAPPLHATPDLVMNGTFHGVINEYVRQMHAQNPSFTSGWVPPQDPPPSIESLNATDDQIVEGYSGNLLPDGYGRVFHLRPNGHQLIANLVLYHISANYAEKLHVDWPAEEVTSDTCAAPAPLSEQPPPETDLPLPMPLCHPAFDDHSDVDVWAQGFWTSKYCDQAKDDGHIIKQGDSSTNIHEVMYYQPGDNAWIYDVFWKDGCTSDVTQRNAWDPMGDAADYNCTSLLTRDFKQCNNGGVGGTITVGCVTYGFSVGEPKDDDD